MGEAQEGKGEQRVLVSRNLFKSVSVVSLWTLISRILGYVRDMVLLRHFSATVWLDIYLAIAIIPGLLRSLILEGPLLRVFLPALSQKVEQGGKASGDEYLARALSAITLITIGIAVLVAVLARPLIALVAPGYTRDPGEFDFAASLLRILALYLVSSGISSILTGALHRIGKFGFAAACQWLFNILVITAVLAYAGLAPQPHLQLITLAVVISGILQVALLLWWLGGDNLAFAKMRLGDLAHPDLKKLYAAMLPALAITGIDALAGIVNNAVLTTQQTGSVTWLYAAMRLVHLPMALVGFALGSVLFPMIVRAVQSNTPSKARYPLRVGVNITLAISCVGAALLLTQSQHVIMLLFERANWGEFDTMRTGQALTLLAPAVIGYMLNALLIVVFYACGRLQALVRLFLASLALKIALITLLVFVFERGHLGIAISESVSIVFRVVMMLAMLLRWRMLRPSEVFRDGFVHLAVLVAVVVAAGVLVPDLMSFRALGAAGKLALICAGLAGMVVLHCVLVRACGIDLIAMLLGLGEHKPAAAPLPPTADPSDPQA